jgi:threonine/homoserine/homoserine lactone efflux protein
VLAFAFAGASALVLIAPQPGQLTHMTTLIWPLLLFAVIAVVTPGANNLLAAASGARFGLRRSTPLLVGIFVSVLAVVAVSAAGLGGVVTSLPAVRLALQVAGTAYIVWLAYRIARGGRPSDDGDGTEPLPGFRAGVLITALNPKAWTMAFSAAASYSKISANPLVLAATLATVFAVVLAPNLVLWCTGGQFLTRVLHTDRQWRIVNVVLGLLLVASMAPMWLD